MKAPAPKFKDARQTEQSWNLFVKRFSENNADNNDCCFLSRPRCFIPGDQKVAYTQAALLRFGCHMNIRKVGR